MRSNSPTWFSEAHYGLDLLTPFSTPFSRHQRAEVILGAQLTKQLVCFAMVVKATQGISIIRTLRTLIRR